MRYLPLTPEDRTEMLSRVGVRHIDDLFADVPAATLRAPDLPPGKSELEVERTLAQMAARNMAADRKSTRLNSSHVEISYAVFCLKKKKKKKIIFIHKKKKKK